MTPFHVAWTQAQIDSLRKRLSDSPIADPPYGGGWSLGCDSDFLRRFRDYWIDGYDWRAAMDLLNRYPQFIAEIDGLPIHFVHVKGEGDGGDRPLILTHGWPGSQIEFWGVIDKLAFPSRHGGKAAEAFDLVIPSLPGYGFSGKPSQPTGPRATAALWNTLMTERLGYSSYLAQGGDWGSIVTGKLGLHHADTVRGIHLNMASLMSQAPMQTDAEMEWAQRLSLAAQVLSGYSTVQMHRPMSLVHLSMNNPLGQAAWILERFHDWADLSRGEIESVFDLDHLITNVMLYVMTDSFASSIMYYNGFVSEGQFALPTGLKCETPLGIAAFPGDALFPVPPRSRVELVAANLMHWSDMPRGGHFAAMEEPDLFAADVLDWGAKVSPVRGGADL